MRARAALAIALFGVVVSPLIAPQFGSVIGVGLAAVSAAVGIALFPEGPAPRG